MNQISSHPFLEKLLLGALQKGPVLTTALIKKIIHARPNTSKQGIYRVLRKLRKEETIVIYQKKISLSVNWIKKQIEFFSLAQFYNASKEINAYDFLFLREKEKIIYAFKNLNLLSVFGDHVFHVLTLVTSPNEPVYVYNPHEWFAYARKETEETLLTVLSEAKRQVFITVIYRDPLDIFLKKQFNTDFLQYHISEKQLFPKKNYYCSIFNDYIMEIILDEKLSGEIDSFYKRTEIFDEKAKSELQKIIIAKSKNKLIIRKDRKKSEKIKKMIGKNFYIIKKITD
jgi:hypothetical protein